MELLIGGPGTGKTTALVNKIRDMRPYPFGLLSFTRQAANEAKHRLSLYYNEKDLDWIRTIHSLAFKCLKLNRNSIFTDLHLKDFGNEYGYQFSNKYADEEDGTFEGLTQDDITYRHLSILTALQEHAQQYTYEHPEVDEELLMGMDKSFKKYKHDKKLMDFNDILNLCQNAKLPRFELLAIDESQDLSPLQFKVVDMLTQRSERVIYAGDDDQMIYEWAGVRRSLFMNLAKICDLEILINNHRLPVEIIGKADGVIGKCNDRLNKSLMLSTIQPTPISKIKRIEDLGEIEFSPVKTYLILARNAFFVRNIVISLYDNKVPFSYLRDSKRRSNIRVSTIHGSKGAEADVVILFTDVTNATYQGITSNSEHRVWYVGMTRTKEQLVIVDPQSKYSYEI